MKKSVLFTQIVLSVFAVTAMGLSISAADQQATVSLSGGVITIKGNESQSATGIKLAEGVYVVRRTAGEGYIGITVKASDESLIHATFFEAPTGTYMLAVMNHYIKPGGVIFEIQAYEPWTLTITKAEAAQTATLPQVLSSAERASAVSKPFKASAGKLTVSYTYKSGPKGVGTISICDIAKGMPLPVTSFMPAGKTSGSFTVAVATAGIYIAQTDFPLGSGGGEVKIAQ